MQQRQWIAAVFLLVASASASAQQGNAAGAGPSVEGTMGIQIDGDPFFKVYAVTDTGCENGDFRMDIRWVHFPSSASMQTVVEAGGLRYMNEQFETGEAVSHEQNWGLFDIDDGGAFSPLTGTWPIPDNTPMSVDFYVRDGFDGSVLYQRHVEISQCNGGDITANATVGREVSQPTRATFAVGKQFADGNPSEVEVTIDCNTGLILDQDKTLTPGVPVEFVVTSFTNATLNCTITEEPVPGYTGSHADSDSDEELDSCENLLVEDGEQSVCLITNDPDPVEIVVTKNWEVVGDNNDVSLGYSLDLDCDSGYIASSDYSGGEGPDSEEHVFAVIPDYPSTSCEVYEYGIDSAVEVDNGCSSLVISAGEGVSCTITNTVFFEGVPSLNQYGMAVLALLMLGVGFVGFRRYA